MCESYKNWMSLSVRLAKAYVEFGGQLFWNQLSTFVYNSTQSHTQKNLPVKHSSDNGKPSYFYNMLKSVF